VERSFRGAGVLAALIRMVTSIGRGENVRRAETQAAPS
jgi:hypothetical protein